MPQLTTINNNWRALVAKPDRENLVKKNQQARKQNNRINYSVRTTGENLTWVHWGKGGNAEGGMDRVPWTSLGPRQIIQHSGFWSCRKEMCHVFWITIARIAINLTTHPAACTTPAQNWINQRTARDQAVQAPLLLFNYLLLPVH